MYNIRLAKQEDWSKVASMSEDFYKFSGYSIPYDADSAQAQFIDAVEGPGAVILAETETGEPVGMIGFLTSPFPVNRRVIVGTEIAWWVEPAHRGGPVAKELMATAEQIAKQVYGAQYFTMSKLRVSPPLLDRFYKKAGYIDEDTSYMKAL